MTWYRPLVAAPVLVAIVALFPRASLPQSGGVTFEAIDPVLAPYGAVDGAAIWTKSIISVCWLNHPEYANERQMVRDAIKNTWEAASGVRLVSWDNCSSSRSDLQISVDETWPRSHVGESSRIITRDVAELHLQ
jgi:hypothetical protein